MLKLPAFSLEDTAGDHGSEALDAGALLVISQKNIVSLNKGNGEQSSTSNERVCNEINLRF